MKYLVIARNELGCEIGRAVIVSNSEANAIDCYIDQIAVKPFKTDTYEAYTMDEHKKEIWFTDMGFFTRYEILRIKKKMDGKTFFFFEVIEPDKNNIINCTLGIRVDEKDFETWGEQEIKRSFIHSTMTQ